MGRVASQEGLRPGTVLAGKVRVERFVGQGSMGVVYEAVDLAHQRRVAVKLMAPERAQDPDARTRFLREARAASSLSSEHVTRLFDVGELFDGTPFLVMEFLVGGTLEHVLLRDGPPQVDVALDWVLQALDGVAEAHRAGFVHRDLKPENLFLCERPGEPPIVKVLDFGTVKDLTSKATKLTRTGSTMGSPAYMPPEQVRAEEIDQRADVWAMGVTLYELLSGQLPFLGASVMQTLAAILRDAPIPLRAHCPDAPPELDAIVMRALSKDPALRYPSANELLAALASVRAQMPRTTRVTRTVNMGRNLHIPRPDEFADTTEMEGLPGVDSRGVGRAGVNARGPGAASPNGATARSRPHVVLLLVALGAALVIGVVGGVVLTRDRAPAPAPELSAPAPPSHAPPPQPPRAHP
ncbi:MAG: serine/threonine protein kinase [Labilithrix sp.]|nr:serine/threonine protein kinase [Labilithrix sp.]